MSEFSSFKYGGTVYPLPTSSPNSLLRDADPAVYWLLEYFSAILTTHLGARLVAEAIAAGAPVAEAVAYKTPLDPLPWLLEEHFTFPLLAVYRMSNAITRKSTNWSQDTCKLGVAYVLPPLTPGQAEVLMPVLTSVSRILASRIEQGFDPSFLNGARVLSAAYANLDTASFPADGSFGVFQGMGNLEFPSWTGTLTITERQMPAPELVALTGTDNQIDLNNSDDTSVVNFVAFKSDIVVP